MLSVLNKTVEKLDIFQEDCSKLIFALRHIIGEDQVINENDLFLKEDEDGTYVYKNKDLVLTYSEEGTFAAPKFSRNSKLIKEATKFLKRNLKESGGSPAPEDFSKPIAEDGGTSVADVSTAPIPLGKTRKDLAKEEIADLENHKRWQIDFIYREPVDDEGHIPNETTIISADTKEEAQKKFLERFANKNKIEIKKISDADLKEGIPLAGSKIQARNVVAQTNQGGTATVKQVTKNTTGGVTTQKDVLDL